VPSLKLVNKISTLISIASLAPVALVLSFSLWTLEQARQQSILYNLVSRTELAASHLSDRYSGTRREVELYAQIPQVKDMDMLPVLDFFKKEIVRNKDRYEKFIISDLEGNFYNTQGGNPYQNFRRTFDDSSQLAKPKNIRQRDYWQYTVGDNSKSQNVSFVSNPMISYTTGARQVVIAASIIDSKQNLQGMIGVSIDWSAMTLLMEDTKSLYFSSYGWDPKLTLISGDGAYWYHWDEDKSVKLRKNKDGTLFLNADGQSISQSYGVYDEKLAELEIAYAQVKEGKSGYVYFLDEYGDYQYFFYSPVKQTKYSIGLLVSEEDLFLSDLRIWDVLSVMVISVIGVIVLVMLWSVKNLVSPLKHLSIHLQNLGRGKYKKDLVLETKDELEDIANTLNNMSKAVLVREQEILTINKELEERVDRRTNELSIANKKFEELSLLDELTSLGNRRAMESSFKAIHAQFLRDKNSYGVMLIDIDFFKNYNDCYGHLEGDTVLRQVAQSFKETMRTSDYIYRYGGEEFVIILPGASIEEVSLAAGRILDAVLLLNIEHKESPLGKLSISIGASCAGGSKNSWTSLLKVTDEALYEAKAKGRNRVCIGSHS
jgi:diguanylate cyclase (GGDEF)-like protein